MKTRWFARLAWMVTGIAALYAAAALADVASGGSLDPPGTPASTMQTLADIAPSWHQKLLANNGDGAGCGSQRFACVLGSTAVLDRESGIVWQRTPSAVAVNWETADGACASLVADSRAGWRLPTLYELRSLMEPGVVNPSLPAGHPFTVPINTIWTSTQSSVSPGETLTVTLATGAVISRPRGDFSTTTMWCVRAPSGVEDGGAAIEPAPPPWSQALSAAGGVNACESPRFRCVLNAEAVLDRETGLVWQRDASLAPFAWPQAVSTCEDLTIADRKGWRVPTAAELATLIDMSGPVNKLPSGHPFTGFGLGPDTMYWTSTNYAFDPVQYVVSVDFTTGVVTSMLRAGSATTEQVLCVRSAGHSDGE